MKELNISYHLEGYSALVNNCMDYNIAGAASFYDKYFLKLYCAIWSIYMNYNHDLSLDISKHILEILGLEKCPISLKNEHTVLNDIIKQIDDGHPLIFYTNTSLLFYCVMYLNDKSKNINHSFIINGYDEEKKLLYIKENVINSDMIRTITDVQPFSSYTFTYDIFLSIFSETKIRFTDKDLLYYIKKNNDIDKKAIKKMLFSSYLELLNNEKDCLIVYLKYVIENGFCPKICYNEQFFRDFYHSYNVIFDFIIENVNMRNIMEFELLRKKIMDHRKNVVLKLAKLSCENKVNDLENIKKIYNKTTKINEELNEFLKTNYISCKEERMIFTMNDVFITADSAFNEYFSENNIIKDEFINDKFSFWRSRNIIEKHWIKIDFLNVKKINGIIVEHHRKNGYVTRDYSIYIKSKDKLKLFKRIKNNTKVINEFVFQNGVELSSIKIIIDNPNLGIDFSARIRKINFF